MGRQLKLVRLNDFIADVDYVDLLADGFDLAVDGYLPAVAPIGARSVNEVITLKLQGSSKDDLAAMTQEIDEKIKQVQWWNENPSVEKYQVWLRAQLDNETYPRQAQILNIRPPEKLRVYNPPEINANWIGEYQIGIERTPFWDMPYPYPTTTNKTLNIIGGMAQLSETINGDVPARVVRLTSIVSASSGRVSDFWIGWKSSRFGNPANFLPVWSLANSLILDSTDTSYVADSSTYAGGNKMVTTFASNATLILRDRALLDDQTANISDQRGSYLVLLRAKMSDTSVARIQMIAGQYSGGLFNSPIYRSRVIVSGTAWSLYELGTIKIPQSRLASGYTFPNFAIGQYAERISGSGNLERDCLILIPFDDGALKLTCTGSLVSGMVLEGFQAADSSLYAAAGFAGGDDREIFSIVPKPLGSWGLPANNEAPYMVIAANDTVGSTGNVKGKTLEIAYTYIPRWRTLRGNVT